MSQRLEPACAVDQKLLGPAALGGRGSPGPRPCLGPHGLSPGLVFRADQLSGHRQLLTLYNSRSITPRELRFASESCAQRLPVFDAEGYVKAQSCIDIVIRPVAPIPSHYDIQDRF